jgi:hypothetical protein
MGDWRNQKTWSAITLDRIEQASDFDNWNFMDWITVYDFGNESLRIGWMFIPISIVIIGYGMSIMIFLNPSHRRRNIFIMVFGISFGTFGLVTGAVTIPHNISTYYETKIIYENKKYKVIEGIVENFHPMPYSGHTNESFTLNGIRFSYSDFDESYYGFNNTESHGGPINQNKKVRLSYFESGTKNIILKIEVPK